MALRVLLLLALAGAAVSPLGGCASNVKGSWSCAIDRGGVCSSITDIDHAPPANARNGYASAKGYGPAPVVADAIPARLWQDAAWQAGPIAGAPVHETDQVVKVAIAPWVDGSGDYHAGSEVYSVMRKGGWYVAPRDTVRRVELLDAPAGPPSPVTAAASNAPVASVQPKPLAARALLGAPTKVASVLAPAPAVTAVH